MDPLSPETPQAKSTALSKYSPRTIATFLGAIVLFSVLIFYSLSQFRSSPSNEEESGNNREALVNIAANTLVYGTWSGQESVILAYDMSTGKEGIIAKLPSNVKKVSVVSPDALLYIKDTDLRDYGREIALYSVSQGTSQTLFTAADEFGIDDYVLSPDKNYIAIWEVKPDPVSETLENGRSRVYAGKISEPNRKNIIQDEIANAPVSYPIAILNDGTVFTDKFLPNSGAGWAYGMSVSNFTGTQKQAIPNMASGSYGTQPVLSPDGKYLAFGGFNGSTGTTENRGFRQAVLTPNTAELLDTVTLQREVLATGVENGIYSNIQWDETGENLYYTVASKNREQAGNYIYSLLTKTAQLKLDKTDQVASALNRNLVLVSESTDSVGSLGNLGSTYESALTQLSVKDTSTGKVTRLPLSTSMTQVIATVPSSYFSNIATSQNNTDNIQLRTFEVKPTLEPKREVQQSKPRISADTRPKCRDLATEQCNATLGTDYPKPKTGTIYKTHSDKDFAQCYNTQWKANSGKCSDSPLYLYGPKGTDLAVTVHTPIFNTSAPYSKGFQTTLLGDGRFEIEGNEYASIDFDYTPALRKIVPPTTGSVVSVYNLEQTLRTYAGKLGLNKKETFDLVQYGKTSVDGPYVFVSFFDHETSHAMLPMTFSQQPDTYRNIVFYFKNVDAPFSVTAPSFNKIERGELTVIEISGLVE